MEDYRTVLKLLEKNYYMCTIDLKDAYYTIPIFEHHKRFLSFWYMGVVYQYKVLPFGLSSAPYTFTKLCKPIVSYLRKEGIYCIVYLDDYLILNPDYKTCKSQTKLATNLLESLGFLVNYEKSNLKPRRECTYLGFTFNSSLMIISLPLEKRQKVFLLIKELLNTRKCSIRFLARVIGILVSSCPAIKYGWLYTRALERFKTKCLVSKKYNYNAFIEIPPELNSDLLWWKKSVFTCSNQIRKDVFDLEIFSDASRSGWGISCDNQTSHGWWLPEDQPQHINFLELKSAFLGLKIFASNLRSRNILLRIDNTTAIAYVNKMGSVRYPILDNLAKDLWQWCEERDIWLKASYISSSQNSIADAESRIAPTEAEFELDCKIYKQVIQKFGMPEIDLFASYSNNKCPRYISYQPDPGCQAVDAFTINWQDLFFYAFPPFCLILRTLKKIKTDKAEGIVVVPSWSSQPFYPLWKDLLVGKALTFSPENNPIFSPFRHLKPPALSLEVGLLSGKRTRKGELTRRPSQR